MTTLSDQNKFRSKQVVDLENIVDDLQIKLNEQKFINKKQLNDILALDKILADHGFSDNHSSFAESLNTLLVENERLKNEIRELLFDHMKTRQYFNHVGKEQHMKLEHKIFAFQTT